MNYIKIVSEITGVSIEDIKGESRKAPIVEARQLAMYFVHRKFGVRQTGRILNRNHSTVSLGAKKIRWLVSVDDKKTLNLVREIRMRVNEEKKVIMEMYEQREIENQNK